MTREQKKIVIVCGISGAGIYTSIRTFEDLGYYCVNNLPPSMAQEIIDKLDQEPQPFMGVVFGVRPSLPDTFQMWAEQIKSLKQKGYSLKVLYLDADDSVLVNRFNTSRRRHSYIAFDKPMVESIRAERESLRILGDEADLRVDTSEWSPQQLTQMIEESFRDHSINRILQVFVVSFGFKFGYFQQAENVHDVRFLTNPHYDPKLQNLTGLDQPIVDFVLNDQLGREFLDKLVNWYRWILPEYYREGRHLLTIAIGCTGGRHRSVCLTEGLVKSLVSSIDDRVKVSARHRELDTERSKNGYKSGS